VASKLKAVFNACEKWAWLAVMLTWALTLLFAAALVLIDLATIIIYPFAGTEENPLLDDRFHGSCHKGGIHLSLEPPIYGSVALGRGAEHHGSVAASD
jgi:hypothetical protein